MSDRNDAVEATWASLLDEAPEARPTTEPPGSDVHPSPLDLDVRLTEALEATERAEVTLADLARTAKFLSATVATVRAANGALSRELEDLAAIVRADSDRGAAREERIERLERTLEETDRATARERQALVEEHDRFIGMLIADHQRELDALRTQLDGEAPSSDANAEQANAEQADAEGARTPG